MKKRRDKKPGGSTTDPEQKREYKRAWRAAHRESIAEYMRAYYQGHREAYRASSRAYQRSHRERVRAYRNARNARRKPPTWFTKRVEELMLHPERYILQALGISLRPYQEAPLKRIAESIERHLGDTFVLIFPRQSGKDELLINLKLYLADLYSALPVGIVEVNPTYRPQTAAAVQRFDHAAEANLLTRGQWRKSGGYVRRLGQLTVSFLSGGKSANVAGATASLLLIVNEAQDVASEVYARKFEPMAASTNATRIFAGTALTARTLLAQEKRLALEAERQDGRKRLFTVDADEVARYAPWYGLHVEAAIRKHGRQHPLVKTQYFNEEIDAQGGMFNAARRALMLADALPLGSSAAGSVHVFCIDVAGQDEAAQGSRPARDGSGRGRLDAASPDGFGNPGRDATSLSIFSVDLSTLETLQAPIFRVVRREQWTGLNHLAVFGQLQALAERWQPRHVIVDATGVGEGLWAMLARALPSKVIPVKFSSQKKSEIGYRFLSLIETGRFRDACATPEVDEQYAACVAEVLSGPQKTLRWGVPDGTRNADGALIHDDFILADALITEVDALEWSIGSPTLIVQARDPLEEMSHFR